MLESFQVWIYIFFRHITRISFWLQVSNFQLEVT